MRKEARKNINQINLGELKKIKKSTRNHMKKKDHMVSTNTSDQIGKLRASLTKMIKYNNQKSLDELRDLISETRKIIEKQYYEIKDTLRDIYHIEKAIPGL